MNSPSGPDFMFWSKLDAWSYRDAALLLCGFDPDHSRGSGIRLDRGEVPQMFVEASKVYRIFKNAVGLGVNAAHPFAIVEHALKKGLPVPAPLLQAVRERYLRERKREGLEVDDSLGDADEDESLPHTRQFLLRLIYVLAMRGYGFNLEKPYNDALEIVGDAERMGLVLDRGAVARYLREARELSQLATFSD